MRRSATRGVLCLLLLALPACADPARERFELAENALLEQRMEDALAGYRSIPKEFPQSRYAPAALLRQADLFGSYYRNASAALDACESLIFTYPGAAEVPQAYLRKGEIHLLRHSDQAAAVDALEFARRQFPRFERMDEILFLLARAYARGPDPERRTAILSELIETFPDSSREREARWMRAFGYLAQERFAEADREFRKLLYLARDSRETSRAHWGIAQALEGMGDLERALEQYEAVGKDGEDPVHVARRIALLKRRLGAPWRREVPEQGPEGR
jgi:TolA-binding protein